ncbi:MAG: acyl-CoA desaturase [Flavobacteriales bacterium]|jgi:stearoyl-CoA desaturase (Delta-9 desaturase)|nr:acyl-CoA desaturase [Flavobacteriales bacterium]MBT4705371.1 acyl-CoA desaturase [Flavobacteriales bacterium]MBT5132252.1 acyl-CoA desaturase [Flavobacteriales bacterium]MBT6382474.1 acyl-CoA desaturase [Flavobacteriales bacterium]MBT6916099.1 acyl-CoA desaturase [Flavobacteriales bacterium]
MEILIFFVAHWYLSLWTQTFFDHRYAAHQMFTMSKGWERFFQVISWVFQGSSYVSAYAYAILHRYHHAYADTEKDPHSPKYDSNPFKMMWRTKELYSDIFYGRVEVEDKWKQDLPEWVSFEKFADSWPIRILWGLFYIWFYVEFAEFWWMYLLLPIHFIMGPFHGAIINWMAHKYGYVNFKVGDTSKNIIPVDIFMLGEGYHNNHHKFGGRPNFGVKWHEIDPVYITIKVLSAFNIIKLKSQPVKIEPDAQPAKTKPLTRPVEVEQEA